MTNTQENTQPVVQNAGTATTIPPVIKVTRRLDAASARDAFWYLKHEEELSTVTKEKKNEAIGLLEIRVNNSSEAQLANYTLANITIDTVIGTITGIQVKESERIPGSLYLQTNSRNIAKDGQPPRWMNDVKLDRKIQAQILSHVDGLLEPVSK